MTKKHENFLRGQRVNISGINGSTKKHEKFPRGQRVNIMGFNGSQQFKQHMRQHMRIRNLLHMSMLMYPAGLSLIFGLHLHP